MKKNKITDKVLGGQRLDFEDGVTLLKEADLLELGYLANHIRRVKHPQSIVTYIIDRNINYTNVCVAQCDFCAFYEKPGSEHSYLLDKKTISQKIEETIELGGTQILMQGGLHPKLRIEYFEDLFQYISKNYPSIRIHCLSPAEITYMAKISGIGLKETIKRLKQAGLASIPGGGAEILVDDIRKKLNSNKTTTEQWLQVMEIAHQMKMKTTATMMFGHIETMEHRIEHLLRIRELQDKTGGFTAFIPWTFQPENTQLGGTKASAYDYLKTLAVSRLMLDNIDNIQVSWVTMGAKIAQVGLQFGGNDFGSLMIEENVVAAAGSNFRMSLDEIRYIIKDAGYQPVQRDMEYRHLQQ
jgi:cyclic dehypoxanthinyl futalosine synthase